MGDGHVAWRRPECWLGPMFNVLDDRLGPFAGTVAVCDRFQTGEWKARLLVGGGRKVCKWRPSWKCKGCKVRWNASARVCSHACRDRVGKFDLGAEERTQWLSGPSSSEDWADLGSIFDGIAQSVAFGCKINVAPLRNRLWWELLKSISGGSWSED